MYQKPRVERFGTLRELTQTGASGVTDGATVHLTPPPPPRS